MKCVYDVYEIEISRIERKLDIFKNKKLDVINLLYFAFN